MLISIYSRGFNISLGNYDHDDDHRMVPAMDSLIGLLEKCEADRIMCCSTCMKSTMVLSIECHAPMFFMADASKNGSRRTIIDVLQLWAALTINQMDLRNKHFFYITKMRFILISDEFFFISLLFEYNHPSLSLSLWQKTLICISTFFPYIEFTSLFTIFLYK